MGNGNFAIMYGEKELKTKKKHMNILIVGAGRMGMRHALGIATIPEVKHIYISDINAEALEQAKVTLEKNEHFDKFIFQTNDKLTANDYLIAILASTADDRIKLVNDIHNLGAKHILVEKPLGQSYKEISELCIFLDEKKINAYVNLNMRLYKDFIKLKNDLNTLPQLIGNKVIMINSGTIGIGANGIHYLDLLFFLLDAVSAEFIAGEIEPSLIPSNRGSHFADFGGWCTINFYNKNQEYIGRAQLSLASTSTAFGGWDIIAPHGRITIDEIAQKRIDHLRKADSAMPIQRYAADYLPPVESRFESPFLGDLTALWVKSIIDGKSILPTCNDSIKTHQLLFKWLSFNSLYKDKYPIT